MSSPAIEEAHYWRAKLEEAKRGGQLDTVHKAASAWTALLSSLLGVVGLVAFAGGLQAIDELDSPFAFWVKLATSLAAIALATATFFAARASGRLFPATSNDTTWQGYREGSLRMARDANADLAVARKAGLVAVVIVFGGSAAALWGPAAAGSPPSVVVQIGDEVVCGPLATGAGGELVVGRTPLDSLTSITVVDRCPSRPAAEERTETESPATTGGDAEDAG